MFIYIYGPAFHPPDSTTPAPHHRGRGELLYTYRHRYMDRHTNNSYTHTHIHTQTHIHTYIHTCMHAYIHTYVHTYIHTYLHTDIHTYHPSPTSQTPHHHRPQEGPGGTIRRKTEHPSTFGGRGWPTLNHKIY